MFGIGAHLSGLERRLLYQLARTDAATAASTLRLATNQRINSPKDDPAAFFQLSSLQSRLSIVNATKVQVQVASDTAALTQLTLDKVRTQLNSIRSALLEDEDGSLSGAQRAANQAEIDAALAEINELAGTEIGGRRLLDGSANYQITGRDPTQVRQVQVYQVGGPAPIITRQSAELVYTGTDRKVAADDEITITGNLGSTTLSVTEDESLEDLADRINQRTATTGVLAAAKENELRLISQRSDDGAFVQLTDALDIFTVTGGDETGAAYGVSAVYGTGPAISGRVETAGQQASLLFTGTSGTAPDAATIVITGNRGSATIDVADDALLTDVADDINAASHKTGITASVDGDELTFTSVDYGTKATISVEVTSGTFAVTGGNGDGTAQGVNAVATINGQRLSGNTAATNATLVHTELTGSLAADTDFRLKGDTGAFFDFSFSAGNSLAAVRNAINAQQGTTGIHANLSEDGLDLILTSTTRGRQANIELDVTSGTFATSAPDGSTVTSLTPAEHGVLTYETVAGLVSNTATIRITGNLGLNSADIDVTAGESLLNVATRINGESENTGVQAKVVGETLYIYSVGTSEDAFAQLQVQSGTFDVEGGDVDGKAFGENSVTIVSGQDEVTGQPGVDGNQFTFNQGGLHFTIEFAAGFSGEFDTITISDDRVPKFSLTAQPDRLTSLALAGVQAAQLGGLSGNLSQLASGGILSGLGDKTSHALRVVDEALAGLTLIEGQVDGFANAAVSASAGLMNSFQTNLEDAVEEINAVNVDEENLLLAKNQQLASNTVAALAILRQQQLDIVSMIRHLAGLE